MSTTEATYKLDSLPVSSRSVATHVSLVFSWADEVRAVALRQSQSLVVGRAEPAQFVIEDRSLSRAHARFTLTQGRLRVVDLASTNGTRVNGRRVGEAWIDEGDVVQLGAIEVRVSGKLGATSEHSAVVSHAVFMQRLEQELARARVFGRTVSVLALRAESRSPSAAGSDSPLSRGGVHPPLSHPPLPQGEGRGEGPAQVSAGPDGSRPPPAWLRALRLVDMACSYAPQLTLVMLAETDAPAAARWVEAGRKASLHAAVGIANYPAHTSSAEALVELALAAARSAKLGASPCVAEVGPTRPNLAAPVVASDNMRRLYDLVARVARTTLPVLVLGETGSGKELIAHAVHQHSPRNKGPFKALNCATIPANLLESILFGHERGAFTGADRQTPGIFEQTQGGTVFLDEVAELSAQAQAALLRVLETRRLVRVGGHKEIEVDVRVVAATHRDLSAMVRAGTFREDLMFRLDALTLRVPPLRERKEEIAPLAELFLARAAEQWGTGTKCLSDDAREALEAYAWPGNVRQLKNVIERAVAVSATEVIDLEDLPEHLWTEPPTPAGGAAGASAPGDGSPTTPTKGTFRALPELVREFEVALIKEALEKAHGNQAQAARMLKVPRRTLANKVHAYGLVEGVRLGS